MVDFSVSKQKYETLIENYFLFITLARCGLEDIKKIIFYYPPSQGLNYKSERIRNFMIEINSFRLINSTSRF